MNKPELIIQDMGGAHNTDKDGTSARLMKGGSWKKQRIIVILPAAESIPAKVALSHWNITFPPNNGVVRILAQGMEVGDAYSSAIESILVDPNLSQWEYVLTLEHDNLPPPDGLLKLIEDLENNEDLSWVSGLYFTKGPEGVAQIWGDVTDPVVNFRPQIPQNVRLQRCHGTGMGFALFRLSMFKDKKLRRPWFVTQTKNGISTQDLYFAADAMKYGYKCAVDTTVSVGHMDISGDFGQRGFIW